MIVLAGDIGGTHARLALIDVDAGATRVIAEDIQPSTSFAGLAPIAQKFLANGRPRPERACYGIAGPVVDNAVKTPNLPWTIDAADMARETGIRETLLINDFAAVGYGVPRLNAADLVTLQAGEPVRGGPIALVGAGTGLGQGFLIWNGSRYLVLNSEGGHVALAATNELEWGLVEFLLAQFGRVSCERVLSGGGLASVYRYLAGRGIAAESPAVAQEMTTTDPAAVVTRHALDGTDALCAKALELFITVYGRHAGHVALTVLSSGGVYLAGGIAPRIRKPLQAGGFIAAFRDQGRLTRVVERMPVHVIVNPDVGLLGSAVAAYEWTPA